MVTKLSRWELISENSILNSGDLNAVDWLPDERYDLFVIASDEINKQSSRNENQHLIEEEEKQNFMILSEKGDIIHFYATTENDKYLK